MLKNNERSESMYTVQEVARIAHTTVKTLHYYHKIGLLIPKQTTEAGYRLYGKQDLERLQQILFFKELDFPLKEIQQLLEGTVDREETLIQQKSLLEQKMERLKGLIETIYSSIEGAREGVEVDMETMFKGFETEKEWEEALREQNEHLKKEYNVDLSKEPLDVESLNESAMEAQSFNKEMIQFLQEGFPPGHSAILERVKDHLIFLKTKGHRSSPQDFLNQTEFFIRDDFHRNMLEQQQVGYAYFLNKVAESYCEHCK
ncbi:MerR family transcriptional regulator [Pullulanibacillus sp. KACC 23026]|uniref:MerR family transcriptional regulator n=1 Tax=Pullulanibacillus sp. KACC 23026 TaxID=3028315 RepID=UPI0023B0C1F3|nr:MerR family transcriptional regulator [Pullulanibacillus sp. KACC 23026]WEG12358.1 MerR family transcriptional regulator [Pullulanibacillus sp. KACC 23026]